MMGAGAWAVYGLSAKLFLSLGEGSLNAALSSGGTPGGLGGRLCAIDQAAQAAALIVNGQMSEAMNQFNGKKKP